MLHCFLKCRYCGLIFILKAARNNYLYYKWHSPVQFLLLLSHQEFITYKTYTYTYMKHCIIVMKTSRHIMHAGKYREQSTMLHYSSWEIWSLKKCLGYLIAFCSLLQGFQLPPSETSILLRTAYSVPAGITKRIFFQLLTFLRSYHYWCQKVKCICNNLGWRTHSEFTVYMRAD